jgi:hypothetical protein
MKFRVFWDVCLVVKSMLANVSEVRTAFYFRAMIRCPDDGGITHL